MALTKPILYSQVAFDATQDHTFTFNVVGGDQVVANQLTIVSQRTGQVVYQQKQLSYGFLHMVKKDILVNGDYYSAYVTVYDVQGQSSVPSNSIQFYCYTTPTFEFSNIPSSTVITNANYNFQVTYNQIEGEGLSSYIFYLYDAQRIELGNSGIKYATSQASSLLVEHLFSGLNDLAIYYVRCVGETSEGTNLDTGMVLITVRYEKPNLYTITELTNNCEGGYIIVKSNFIAIDGTSNPDPPKYVNNNTMVDITGNGHYIDWNSGYEIDGDFTASLWGRSFGINKTIIAMTDDENNTLTVNYRKTIDNKYYVDCLVESENIRYYIYSNLIDVWANFAEQQIWFRRINGIYDIELHVLNSEPSTNTSMLGMAVLGQMILGED